MQSLETLIRRMPKVELHVHLEGSVQPATLLKLARKHQVELPAQDAGGLREWYQFRDFDHFIEMYLTVAYCLRSGDDIELIAREFLAGQAEQNILYSEVTFTPHNQFMLNGLGFREQLDAVNRARRWAEAALGVRMGLIIDIPRQVPPAEGDTIADWVIGSYGDGVIALGLAGVEVDNPPEKFQTAITRVQSAGIPCVFHAGETDGPASIWSAIEAGSRRIGHGVRAVEDARLMAALRERQIPLEVCPSSNICLKVFPSWEQHSLPRLMAEGLYVTINSDDPPMFNTTLTEEYLRGCRVFGWDAEIVERLVMNAVNAALLPDADKEALRAKFAAEFARLKAE